MVLPGAGAPRQGRPLLRRNVPLPFAVALCAACFLVGMATNRMLHPPASFISESAVASLQSAGRSDKSASGGLAATDAVPQVVERRQAVVTGAAPSLLPQSAPYAPLATHGTDGNDFVDTLHFQVLSWHPRIVYYPGFASAEKCEHIRGVAERRLAPSSLALRAGDTVDGTKDIRTSQGTFVTGGDDPEGVIRWLEKRIADVTMVPSHHGEPFNVLRYELGQKYDSHYDTFDPESYGPQYSQRMASFLLYLSGWEDGGETVFPLEGADGLSRLQGIDYRSCDKGLRVKPIRAGDAVIFYNMHPNATFDKAALHGGCPVKQGTKWVMTRWIRDKSFGAF